MKPWKTISSHLAFDTKWFKVRQDKIELPSGKVVGDYFLWIEKDTSYVVPITSENKFVLEKQYRHGTGSFMIEFPAGYIEDDETAEEAAKRELLEETGYSRVKFNQIGKLAQHPSKEVGTINVILAEGAFLCSKQILDKDEEIEILELTADEILKMIDAGEIWASGTIAPFFMALNKLGLLDI